MGSEARNIDINADAGESFGQWTLGADEELAPVITSINVACGWHAGDPATMARSVALARAHDLALGSHPGFPDLMGFGRRAMALSPIEAAQAVLYQTGALRAFAEHEGVPLRHVKPTGSLYGPILVTRSLMRLPTPWGSPALTIVLEAECAGRRRSRGHRTAAEAFADLYSDDGHIIIDPRTSARKRLVPDGGASSAERFVPVSGTHALTPSACTPTSGAGQRPRGRLPRPRPGLDHTPSARPRTGDS